MASFCNHILQLLLVVIVCQVYICMPIWYRLSADLGAFVGLAHEPSLGGSPLQSPGPSVCPFPMPAQYEEAKESKVQTVATLRNSIKSVSAYLYIQVSWVATELASGTTSACNSVFNLGQLEFLWLDVILT